MKIKRWFNVFCDLQIESSRYLVCFLFMLAGRIENELDLSLYSLSSKTSRYAHFGHNRLTVYGHPVSRLMLPLQPQFWISEHAVCHLWNLVSRLSSRNILPESGLPFVRIRLSACDSNCYNEIFSKFIVWPQNFIKLYYGPKRYESFQIGPISEFLNNALSIPKLFEIMISPTLCEIMISPKLCKIIEWPKIFK